MDGNLKAIVERLEQEPKDLVSLQALADYFEERGAEVSPLRSLTAEDGDVIILGFKPYNVPPSAANADLLVNLLTEFFGRHGKDVLVMVMPANWTVRRIRAATAPRPE